MNGARRQLVSALPARDAWTVGLGTTLAFGNWGALPFIVGAIIDGAGFRADSAGLLGTVELTLMGVSMLVIAPQVPRLNRATAVLVALPVVIGAQLVSAFLRDYYALMAVWGISGIAFGMLFTVGTAEGADSDEPERAYAAASVITMLFGIVKTPLLGYSKQYFGYRGVFLALTGYYLLVGLPLLVLLRRSQRRSRQHKLDTVRPGVSWLGAAGVLSVMSFYAVSTGGVFAFVERVANHVGISASELGRGFSVSALIATLGGTAAARLGLRWGRLIPTAGGLAILGALSLWLMGAPSVTRFWLTYIPWAVLYWFTYAYIMGLSVLVDPLGRLATVTSSVLLLGGAAGAGLAGLVIQNRSLSAFGVVAAAICLCAGLAASVLILRNPHRSAAIAAPS